VPRSWFDPADYGSIRNVARAREQGPGWLLIETFGWPKEPPSIVNWAGRPRDFVPLGKPLQPAVVTRVHQAIELIAKTRRPLSVAAAGLRVEAVGHWVDGRLHAVQYWSGRDNDATPPRPRAGSWWIDVTDMTAMASPEYAELSQIPEEFRGHPRSVAAMFSTVTTDPKESLAIKTMVQAEPGTNHQAVWTVHLPDGSKFRSHFATRYYRQPGHNGEPDHVVCRGVSTEVTMPGLDDEPEPIVLLEHKILESSTRPGEYRALISLESLRLIRWAHGSPVPDRIAWQGAPGQPEPAVHPDDKRVMIDMAKGLDRSSTSGSMRVRGVDGQWIAIDATANLVALGRDATAALVMFTMSETD
jgi:hypothetical protein